MSIFTRFHALILSHKVDFIYLWVLLFISSLYFPLRYVFYSPQAYLTGAYSDFTSFSIYLSDILTISAIPYFIFRRISPIKGEIILKLLVLLGVFSLFIHFNSFISLNLYFFARLLLLLVAYGTFKRLWKNDFAKNFALWTVVWLSSFQSVVAILQFIQQKSLNFKWLGENVLAPGLIGIAKIDINNIKLIRAYGTFPHPNVLSAFLVISILVCTYLIATSDSIKKRVVLSSLLSLNVFGLVVTFSRAAFATSLVSLVLFFAVLVAKKIKLDGLKIAAMTLFVSIFCSWMIFHPYIATRATISDSSVEERVRYTEIGFKIIKHNLLTGVGIGESVLHMKQFSETPLEYWEIQPIHNYFLLFIAEFGIVGLLLIIFLLFYYFKFLIHRILKSDQHLKTVEYSLYLTIFAAIVLLMQFDHYFYTIPPTQYLLWIFLGIVAAEIKNSPKEGGRKNFNTD